MRLIALLPIGAVFNADFSQCALVLHPMGVLAVSGCGHLPASVIAAWEVEDDSADYVVSRLLGLIREKNGKVTVGPDGLGIRGFLGQGVTMQQSPLAVPSPNPNGLNIAR